MDFLFPVLCLFAHMAIMSHIFIMMYKVTGSTESKDLEKKLNPEQKKIYSFIKKERKQHYTYGLLLGMVLALGFNYFMGKNKKQMLCVYIGIVTLTANFFYLLMPKTYWMIEHLEEKEDILAWNKVYKKMKYLTTYAEFVGFFIFVIGHFM